MKNVEKSTGGERKSTTAKRQNPASRRSLVAQSPVKISFESPVLPQASYSHSSRANQSMDRPHSQSTVDEDLGHIGVGGPENIASTIMRPLNR